MRRLDNIWKDDSVLLHSSYDSNTDILTVCIKSATDGSKSFYNLDKPLVPVYILKKDVPIKNRLEYANIKDLTIYWVPEKHRNASIADIVGIPAYYQKVADKEINKDHVFLHKRVFGADKNIEDLVIWYYARRFTKINEKGLPVIMAPTVKSFHIGAFDIETDVNVSYDREKQPINAITYIDNKTWKIKTIAVKNKDYKGQLEVINNIEQFEHELKSTIYKQIQTLSLDNLEEPKKSRNEKIFRDKFMEIFNKLSLDLTFVNSESTMIRNMNKYIFNENNPDFAYAYNTAYDIGQQELRAKELGINFDNLFKYKDLTPFTNFKYYGNSRDPKERRDTYNMNNPTKILDQWLLYYQSKQQDTFSKTGLEATANREIGFGKLDYSHICNFIGDLPYVDFKTFLIYNIIDVLVMLLIDEITSLTMVLTYRRINLLTDWDRLNSPMKRTTSAFDYYAWLDGNISCNEYTTALLNLSEYHKKKIRDTNPKLANIIHKLELARDKDPSVKIEGGLCTSPTLIDSSIKENNIFGNLNVPTYVKLESCADSDAKAMYPNNTECNNASKSTLWGVVSSVNNVAEERIGTKIAMALINQNLESIGKRLFNLPDSYTLASKYLNKEPVYSSEDDIILKRSINREDIKLENISKEGQNYIKLFNACYKTKYTKKELESDIAPSNKLLILSDKLSNSFSYNGTKVTLETPISTNEMVGISGKGLTCGKYVTKDNIINNKYNEFLSFLFPKSQDPELSVIVDEGELDDASLERLANAKYLATPISFGDYTLELLHNVVFTNYKVPIKWVIQRLKDNDTCLMLRLFSEHILDKKTQVYMRVEQKIIFYDLNRKR